VRIWEHAEEPADDEFAGHFARALARDGDEQTLLALLRAAGDSQDVFSVQADVLRSLISVLGTDRRSPVFTGTEMSSPGTEISPGSGTEMSPGQIVGRIDLDVTLEALVDFAAQLRRQGALDTISFR